MHISSLIALALALALTGTSLAAPVSDSTAHPDHPRNMFAKRVIACYTNCVCGGSSAQALATDMINRGTQTFGVNTNWSNLDQSGSCILWGRSYSGFTTSYARDIGYGAQNIVDNCIRAGTGSGANTAGGNGNFLLNIGTCPH